MSAGTIDSFLRACYTRAATLAVDVDDQGSEAILLAMQEALGGLTRAHQDFAHGDGEREIVAEKLTDLGALCIQLAIRLASVDDD